MTIYDVTPDQIGRMKKKLADTHGTVLSETGPDAYLISGHGIVAEAKYTGETQTLEVHLTHHPFYVSEEMVEDGIEKALNS